GLQESSRSPGAGSSLLAGNGTPVIRVGGQETSPSFEVLVGFGQTFHGGRPSTDNHVTRRDRVVGDFVLVQRGNQPPFANDEHRPVGIRFTEELSRAKHGRRT